MTDFDDGGSEGSFHDSVARLEAWCIVTAGRAWDLSLEWPAMGIAATGLYLLIAVAPRRAVNFLDIAVLIGLLGAGIALGRFERKSSAALEKLAKDLAELRANETQSGEQGTGYANY